MMRVLGWRLWYGDGSTYSNRDGSWADAPADNVQALELAHEPPYRTLVYGIDTYELEGEPAVKDGRSLPDAEWEALRLRLNEATPWL